ncbi:MAG: hypothetical protein QW507_00585 [Candidatus Nanoarchaeia archaeon]|nr:hypothetical protein [Candidatus Haiyanarchaeum thermophilum]MCW1302922.1 hypothetical protein [Candidatus Haiyanarchaeum thermophilum]MCW1303600.1 hypothetical protein [Candidatus Haiyanarchaeum thermophilum]MCW1306282.1 hypothetical protein [Candidatus Haiyanarchaeum thermophilum]MCW1307208.1 hypothetical protein [Candidatus Haiyanarchaeum thermophilum]
MRRRIRNHFSIFFYLLILLLSLGCIAKEEIPQSYEDIKVLFAGSKISRVAPDTNTFVVITIMNNALGGNATSVIVSLENVEPFRIVEGGKEYSNPSERRKGSPYGYTCDDGKEVRTHCMEGIMPGEIIDFFWILKVPSKEEIGKMVYDHQMYYTVKYNYVAKFIYRITAINEEELIRGSRVSNSIIYSTPSPIKFEGKTPDNYVVFSTNQSRESYLIFSLSVIPEARGTVEGDLSITVFYPSQEYMPSEIENWIKVSEGFSRNISAIELATSPEFYLPLNLPPDLRPFINLDFRIELNYTFIKNGNFMITVVPIKI